MKFDKNMLRYVMDNTEGIKLLLESLELYHRGQDIIDAEEDEEKKAEFVGKLHTHRKMVESLLLIGLDCDKSFEEVYTIWKTIKCDAECFAMTLALYEKPESDSEDEPEEDTEE